MATSEDSKDTSNRLKQLFGIPTYDGVSAQTASELIRLGIHPKQDAAITKTDTTAPKYKDTGRSQSDEYRRVLGDEAAEEKKRLQEEKRKELFRKLREQQKAYDKQSFVNKFKAAFGLKELPKDQKDQMEQLAMDLVQTTPAGALAGITKNVFRGVFPPNAVIAIEDFIRQKNDDFLAASSYTRALDSLHAQAFQGYKAGQHTFDQATEIYNELVKRNADKLQQLYKASFKSGYPYPEPK